MSRISIIIAWLVFHCIPILAIMNSIPNHQQLPASGNRYDGVSSPETLLMLQIAGKRLLLGSMATTAIMYILFQKNLLPKSVSAFVSKVLFLPTFPITALLRLGND